MLYFFYTLEKPLMSRKEWVLWIMFFVIIYNSSFGILTLYYRKSKVIKPPITENQTINTEDYLNLILVTPHIIFH